MPRKTSHATIRVVVKMTKDDVKTLQRHCENEVRTVGSWFRLQVRRAWQNRKPPKKHGLYQRNANDGVSRQVDVWARLTEEERDQLEVLCGDENVSISIWYRRRLPQTVDKKFVEEQRRAEGARR